MGCPVESLPMKNLGLPLARDLKREDFWALVLKKIGKGLDGWTKAFIGEGRHKHLVGHIVEKNIALLDKWLWRFSRESLHGM